MSHFMSSMPPAGLMLMPPVSNVTPLPMNATGLPLTLRPLPEAPFHCMTTMRGSFALPCATPSNAPKPSSAHLPRAQHVHLQSKFAQLLAAIGHLRRVQHVGRLADQIA